MSLANHRLHVLSRAHWNCFRCYLAHEKGRTGVSAVSKTRRDTNATSVRCPTGAVPALRDSPGSVSGSDSYSRLCASSTHCTVCPHLPSSHLCPVQDSSHNSNERRPVSLPLHHAPRVQAARCRGPHRLPQTHATCKATLSMLEKLGIPRHQ